jgi:CRP/FNR family transcriptional regulator/CRP/FNR family cyclic AMP-dependent transcriptional regulator
MEVRLDLAGTESGRYAPHDMAPGVDSSVDALQRAMSGTPILASVEPATVRDLAGKGTVRRYRRGTYLFHQGDDAPSVYFLVNGRVEISSLSVTGHRQLHTTLEGSQFFGELGVLGQMPRTATGVALEDTDVWAVDGDLFLDFLSAHTEVSKALLRVLSRQVQAHEAFVEDLLFLDLKGRVAKRLLQLVSPSLDDLPDDGVVLPSVVRHADLASLCGGSRENVTRILSEFQRRGLVEKDERRYVLSNVNGLRKLAQL